MFDYEEDYYDADYFSRYKRRKNMTDDDDDDCDDYEYNTCFDDEDI